MLLVTAVATVMTQSALAANITVSNDPGASAAWIGTVGPVHRTTFNSLSEERSFNTSSITFDGITFAVDRPGLNTGMVLEGNKLTGPDLNADLAFYQFDGTPFVALDLIDGVFDPDIGTIPGSTIGDGSTFSMSFSFPRKWFGADFVGLGNGPFRKMTFKLYGPDNTVIDQFDISGRPSDEQPEKLFVGITSLTAFDRISLTYNTLRAGASPNDYFGMDNVLSGPVPEPLAWLSSIIGLFAIGVAGRRKQWMPLLG